MSRRFTCTFLIPLLLATTPLLATTYQVGPSRAYTTLPALLGAVDLEPGDVVEVDGDASYAGGVIVRAVDGGSAANPVVLRGVRVNGRRPHLAGGGNTIEFRQSDHVVFEGFEVSGGSARCVFVAADDITIRDAEIHACPAHGILSADNYSGSLTLEYSEIHDAGNGTYAHALYIQSDEVAHPGSVFRMQHCYLHDGNGGNLLKSRHERNEIYYNWIEGAHYHELELIGPDQYTQQDGWSPELVREDSDVVGNVIVHDNPAFGFILRVGGDGTGESRGRVRFVNNTVLLTSGAAGTVFRIFDGIQAVEAHNNVFYAIAGSTLKLERSAEAVWSDGRQVGGSNNWFPSTAQAIPGEWSDSRTGNDPGFANLVAWDLAPAANSPLQDAANPSPLPIPGYAVANALHSPAWQARRGSVLPGTAAPRGNSGPLDVGAFERIAIVIFQNGFDG